jgi:VCBS repeat-containing protein
MSSTAETAGVLPADALSEPDSEVAAVLPDADAVQTANAPAFGAADLLAALGTPPSTEPSAGTPLSTPGLDADAADNSLQAVSEAATVADIGALEGIDFGDAAKLMVERLIQLANDAGAQHIELAPAGALGDAIIDVAAPGIGLAEWSVATANTDRPGAGAPHLNHRPVAFDDGAPSGLSLHGAEDAEIVISRGSLLANDADADGDNLFISGVGNAVGGTVSLVDGDVVFTPSTNYNGPARFDYTVSDGNGGSSTATVELTVSAANDAPVAVADAGFSTAEDTPLTIAPGALLANDSDLDGDSLVVGSVDNGVGGTVALVGGDVVFTPTANFNGAASFDYTVSDGHGGSATATVSLTVTAVNDAPLAVASLAAAERNVVISGQLTATDADTGDTLTYSLDTQAINGTVAIAPDGSYTYTPDPFFSGPDSFSFRVTDGSGATSTATVSVDVLETTTSWTAEAEFRANTTTALDQSQSSMAVLTGGGYVIAWETTGQDGSGRAVYAQLYDSAGDVVGTEFRVNLTTASDQDHPAVTGLADGGFLITWESTGQDGALSGVYGQRYDAAGATVGGEFLINTTVADNQDDQVVTLLADGGFVVVWQSANQDGGGVGLYGQRFDAAGAQVGGEFLINTTTAGNQSDPNITALTDGGFVVIWHAAQDGSGVGVYARHYDAAGAATGSEFRVNVTTASDQQDGHVAALASGGFVAVWQSNGQDGSSNGVYGRLYDATGAAIGGEFLVNTTTADSQINAWATGLPDGGFVVAWYSSNQDGSGTGVYAQKFDADGVAVGPEFLVNETTAGDQRRPEIHDFQDDSFIVAWNSSGQDGSGWGVYGRKFEAEENSTQAHSFSGTQGNDVFSGGSFDDSAVGGAGNDVLQGQGGDDLIQGGAGNDVIDGGIGIDLIDFSDAQSGLNFSLVTTSGVDTVADLTAAGLGVDTYRSIEGVIGSDYADLIVGNAANNVLSGGAGADDLAGGGGIDQLDGGLGDDRLQGDAGADQLTGGGGGDRAVFTGLVDAGDIFQDFSTGEGDVMDLDALFDALNGGIADGARNSRVELVDVGADVEVRIDTAAGSGAGDGVGDVVLLTLQGLGSTAGLTIDNGSNAAIQTGTE